MKKRIALKLTGNSPQMIVISFVIIICFGTFLLLLPWSVKDHNLTFVDALFTSVSATCVTGLTVIDTGSHLTLFGQVVVLMLIQVGGLGIMTFSTFFIILLGRKISIRDKDILDITLSYGPVPNIIILLRKIMVLVFLIEFAGMVLLSFAWLRYYPYPKAVYYGVFHAISAFCNAGFSLSYNSFENFGTDGFINSIIMALIILGGVGFIVLIDFKKLFKKPFHFWRMISFHTKVVLTVTFWLIFLGTLFIFFIEQHHTLAQDRLMAGFMKSLFQSVTARTAGFNTIPIDRMTNGACLILIILMFFGGAPGSCAGGVKVTTLGVIGAVIASRLRGYKNTHLFYRSISKEVEEKALVIGFCSLIVICVIFLGLLVSEYRLIFYGSSRGQFIQLLFESVSAFGTVGLSMGITDQLSVMGRLLIIGLMFVGRLGPLTIAVALTRDEVKRSYRYAKGELMLG